MDIEERIKKEEKGFFSKVKSFLSPRNLFLAGTVLYTALSVSCSGTPVNNAPDASLFTKNQNRMVKSKIVFISDREDKRKPELYIMSADGSNLAKLTNNATKAYYDSKANTGKKIVFSSYKEMESYGEDYYGEEYYGEDYYGEGNDEIYIENADGSNKINLTNNSANDIQPALSPDGKKIAFVSDRDGSWEIYIMNSNGSNLRRLTNDPNTNRNPDWSPDGKKIVFVAGGNKNKEIHIVNSNGSNLRRLTDNPAWDYEPVWSPDGTKIVFSSERDGNSEIYIMNADGSNQTNLTNNPAHDSFPDWK